MSEKFRRHLAALLWKNTLLKRRHPCSLCCELFLAVGATGLLVLARMLTSNIKAMEIPAQVHVDNTRPVHLPDCAEYLADCSVRLLKPHNPLCVKDVTFGCKAAHDTSGRGHWNAPGVWVSMGCWGTFDLGPGIPHVHCDSSRFGKAKVCHARSAEDCAVPRESRVMCSHSDMRRLECEAMGCCYDPSMPDFRCFQQKGFFYGRRLLKQGIDTGAVVSSLLSGSSSMGMRRVSAQFGIAPRSAGGEAFRQWLVASGHPWADNVRLFDSAEDMQAHVTAERYPERDLRANTSSLLCGAVIFETPPESPEVRYTLRFNVSVGYDPNVPLLVRMMTSTKIKTNNLVDPPSNKAPGQFNSGGMAWYTQSGFLAIQRTVDNFLEERALELERGHVADIPPTGVGTSSSWLGEDGRPHVIVPFPTARWKRDPFAMLMPNLLAFFLLISLAYSVNRMITAVVHEREVRLRDGMRMMGMHTAAFYSSWIVTYMTIYLFVTAGVVFCLSAGKILPHSSSSLLFVWLLLFAAASISYALVITTFFNKAKTAATVGSVVFYTSGYLVHLAQASSSPGYLRLLSLSPPVCFELAAKVFADMESQGVGVEWQNAHVTSRNFSIRDGCCMLAVDSVLFLLIFLYLDQVVPREVGLQRPWYFPLQPSFWRELCDRPGRASASSTGAAANAVGSDVGPAPAAHPKQDPRSPERTALVERDVGEAAAMMSRSGQTVELRGLSKAFGDILAVRKLDLVMYQGEIFALLGHNGAGKTTTLAMLCGLMRPSEGSCAVFGCDLSQESAQVQKMLGVCPQHDVLWDELSCEEHLILFAGFKGVPRAETAQEVVAVLQRVGLCSAGASTRHAGSLSGGMKRKLSLGIAFLGGSRLVVLDEPTSGLDPYSRRMVWELLRAMKQGRVTVLSTHYMDEADILGDRIAILHEGRLRCCGSPQFLKRAYDCGYNVTFVKLAGCETDAVREAVCRHMPELASEVTTLSDSGNELILQFPFAAARLFPQVLGGIEQHMDKLKVESYGVSVTTLEEVFLKVASGESMERQPVVDSGGESDRAGEYVELQELPPSAPQAREVHLRMPTGGGGDSSQKGASGSQPMATLSGAALSGALRASSGLRGMKSASKQLLALLQKRCRYGLRDRRGLLCQLFLPSCTLLLLLLLMSARLFYSMPALELQAYDYNQHCTGNPRNLVDFSYLSSVGPADAEEVLAPGRPFWQGDLRRSDPLPEGEEDWTEERALTTNLPGVLRNILLPAVQKLSPNQAGRRVPDFGALRELLESVVGPALQQQGPGRRLDDAAEQEALQRVLEARLEALLTRLWAAETQVRDGLGALSEAAGLPLLGDLLGLDLLAGRGLTGVPPDSSAAPRRLRGSCTDASNIEEQIWQSADSHGTGRVDKERARQLIRNGIRVANGRSDSQGPNAGEEALDEVLEEALFLMLDQDGDHVIEVEEFCTFSAEVRHRVGRWYGFAERFSEQLMNSSSECTRYGAYYVLSPARTSASAKWAAGSDAVVFVNTSSSHAAAVFHAALTNARFSRLGLRKKVSVKVHPFPQTRDEQHSLEKVAVFLLAIYITFCLSFIPSGIAHFVVKERQTGARQLQVLSGASHLSYWLANLIYDVALYVVPALCVPLALHQFGFEMILAGECGKALAAVLAAFGPAVASFSYLVAFLFKDHSKASNAILTFCLIGASVLSTVLFILSSINYNPLAEHPTACETPTKSHPEGTCLSPLARQAARILGPVFRLVPTVCVYQALFFIALIANLHAAMPEGAAEAFMAVAGEGTSPVSFSPFAYDWAGQPLQYLCMEAVGYFALAVVLDVCMHNPRLLKLLDPACWASSLPHSTSRGEGGLWAALTQGWRGGLQAHGVGPPLMEVGPADASPNPGDDTVEVECERAAHVSVHDVALHIWQLEKTYQSWLSLLLLGPAKNKNGCKRAVQGVSLAVHSGEVFGLLGHNGAGKTSALKCIVGELCCTRGRVHVGGHDMEKQAGEAQQSLGYCPQFDALLELLTVQDHLDLFAALKGLPRESAVQAKRDFNLSPIAHRRAELLSGGNKRKLSAALALLGGPRLAVLDEPSCGLDPAARRALWATVHSVVAVASTQTSASAVLLTTHSMEEAEALSSRLGIMAEGRLLTVGTAQQIKQRRGGAHELCLTLRPESDGLLAETLQHLGGGALAPETPVALASLAPLLGREAAKRSAYERSRCVVRAQIEATGRVEASVLAEWWLQQSRGESIERFLRDLVGEGVELAENFGAYWRFCLPHGQVGLPELFRQLEEGGSELGIAEYTLTQATLEQIFNGIAQDAEGHQVP